MHIRRWSTVAVLGAALVAGGCGESEEVKQRKEAGRAAQEAFKPIRSELERIAVDLGAAQSAAEKRPDATVGKTFDGLAERMAQQAEAVKAIDPPPDQDDNQQALVSAIEKAVQSLRAVAESATAGDADETKADLEDLSKVGAAMDEKRIEYEGALRSSVE